VAKTDAHEGGVYHPDNNEFYFSSSRHTVSYATLATSSDEKPSAGKQNTEVKKISLSTGEVTTVFPVTDVANGMVLDKDGHLLICQQGQGDKPGYIQRVDVKTLNTSIVADNWFGVPFNSPNDVVVKSDGTIWFTDPIYARYITSSRNSQMHLHDGNCSSLPKHSHHVNCCKTISS
jgi:gluconolactonase